MTVQCVCMQLAIKSGSIFFLHLQQVRILVLNIHKIQKELSTESFQSRFYIERPLQFQAGQAQATRLEFRTIFFLNVCCGSFFN